MAQSFNIRPPEDVAFAYGFDKQKIAQAVADKKLDETSAVITLMFLNAGERQKAMQAGQQPTVAQQVLGGGGAPAPLAAAPAASAGIGAPPMPPPPSMPQPEMGMPPQEMPQPEMGMAAGGLTTLPLPDTMFDEPTNGGFNDGYAGGGMVAFANGGSTADLERLRKAIIAQESDGDYGVLNAEGSGAMGAYQFMPPTARALAERLGLPYRPELLQGKGGRTKEGREYQDALGTEQLKDALKYSGGDIGKAGAYHFAGPNKAGHGPKTREYEQDILRRYSGSKEGSETLPERDLGTAEGRGMSIEDAFGFGSRLVARSPEQEAMREEARARFEEMRSPETYEKERKADMWQTLAEIGFNMASSKAPNVLQAIGEAASAALPGARADKKERKALKDRALQGLMQLSEGDEKLARDGLAIGMDIAKSGREAEQFERELTSREGIANRELELRGLIAASKADGDGKKNTKADFIETFYQQFLAKGYQPNIARQYAFIAAEKALAKIKGTSEGLLFGDEEKTGGGGGGGANSEEDPFEGFSATRN